MKNYNYVTTPPCTECGVPTELVLNDEDYARYLAQGDSPDDGDHIICPRDY